MFSFSQNRAKRRTVTVVLVAWVFALMAGIANACILQDGEPGHSGPKHENGSFSHMTGGHAHASVASQVVVHEEDGEPTNDAGTYKDSCKKFCDSESSTALKKKGDHTPDFGHTAAHVVGAFLQKPASVASVLQPIGGWATPLGPSISIRLLRLTL